jgi:ribose transport system permease protein
MTVRQTERHEGLVARAAPWGTVIALGVLIVAFGVAKPSQFFAVGNLQTILSQGAGLGLVAAGLTLVLILGEFDLSVAAMATLSGLASALLVQKGVPVGLALLMALGLGFAVGVFNGLVVVALNVSSFIATLATTALVTGLGTWWAGSKSVAVTDDFFLSLSSSKVVGIPLPAAIAAVGFAVLWVVLERTRPGRMLYAVGSNLEAARLAGVRVGFVRVMAFATCSAFAALAGILLASRLSAGYQGAGDPYLLTAFAAVFLGAVTVRIGEFHILGTAVGILLLSVLSNGLDVVSAPSYVAQLVSGAILIAAVALAGLRESGVTGPAQVARDGGARQPLESGA